MSILNTYGIGKSYNVISDASATTGTTAGFAILKSVSWTTNQFEAGDIVTIEAAISKQGSNGGYYHAVYYNTVNNLTNAKKIFESSVNSTDDALLIPATLTYSNIYCRLQVVTSTNSTKALDPNRLYTGTTFSTTQDLTSRSSTTPGSFWQDIGTSEGNTLFNWAPSSGTLYIHIVGGVTSSSDTLRCEWVKVSGMSNATYQLAR